MHGKSYRKDALADPWLIARACTPKKATRSQLCCSTPHIDRGLIYRSQFYRNSAGNGTFWSTKQSTKNELRDLPGQVPAIEIVIQEEVFCIFRNFKYDFSFPVLVFVQLTGHQPALPVIRCFLKPVSFRIHDTETVGKYRYPFIAGIFDLCLDNDKDFSPCRFF